MSSRKIGYTESIFTYLHDNASGVNNTVARADISGEFIPDTLVKALRFLFDRHPFLHSILVQEGDDVWVKPTACFEDIPILFGSMERSIEEESQDVVDTLYDTSKFLWKIAIYPGEKTTHFLFGFHHAVADGLSLLAFFHQLTETYEKLVRNPFEKCDPMPLLPNIEKLVGKDQTIEDYNKEHHAEKEPVDRLKHHKTVPIDERHDRIDYYSLSEAQLEKLVNRAREEETTVNSLLFTAMCFACAKQEGRSLTMSTFTPVNLRKCLNPPVGDDHLGVFISPIDLDFHVDLDRTDLIAFGKKYREKLFEKIPGAGHKPGNLEGISTFRVYEEFKDFNQQECDDFPCAVAMTNLGRSPFPKAYVDHKIEHFYFATNRLIGDIKYTLHISTVNDQLHIAQVHTFPLTTDEESKEFKDIFLKLIEQI